MTRHVTAPETVIEAMIDPAILPETVQEITTATATMMVLTDVRTHRDPTLARTRIETATTTVARVSTAPAAWAAGAADAGTTVARTMDEATAKAADMVVVTDVDEGEARPHKCGVTNADSRATSSPTAPSMTPH